MSATAQRSKAEGHPGRVSPREASQLADAAWVSGVTRGSAHKVLELLLRLTRGAFTIERSVRWIANDVHISHRTAQRAIHDLITADLVIVTTRGNGHTTTRYLVDLELLRGLANGPEFTPPKLAVRPGELADSDGAEGCQSVTPGVPICHPRGANLSPPSARARSTTPFNSYPPSPPERSPEPPGAEASPDDVGAPFQITGDIDAKCSHGRTVAQGGCRPCGTTARQLVDQREQRARVGRIEQQRRDQATRRAHEAELQAASTPPPADLKAIIRAGRSRR